jgi:hypothetical protein
MNCRALMNQPIDTSRSGQTLCGRHHIALVTVPGFRRRGDWIIDATDEEAIMEACNPNSIPADASLKRSKECPVPANIRYCPKCEEALRAYRAHPKKGRPSWFRQWTTGTRIVN